MISAGQKVTSLSLPANFNERCRAVKERIEAGDAMTLEYIADELGMPFAVFSVLLTIEILQRAECPITVAIDLRPSPQLQ